MRILSLASAALLACTVSANAASVINSASITNPATEDFNALSQGVVPLNSPTFQNLGIVDISGTRDPGDLFENRTNSSRGLGIRNDGAIRVVNPGNPNAVLLTSISMSFSGTLTQIGFGWHDQGGQDILVEFLNGGSIVDSYLGQGFTASDPGNPGDLNSIAFEAAAFDQMTFKFANFDLGFILDDLVVGEIAPVPLPATLPLLAGLIGFGALFARRRKT